MTVTAHTSRRSLGVALRSMLGTINGLGSVFDGEVPAKPPLITGPSGPDTAGRVAPYAVVYTNGGTDQASSLDGTAAGLMWGGQITFAAGYATDLEDVLDRALPAVRAWRPVVPGIATGLMRPPIGFDPGPIRRDDGVKPSRFYLPTLWELQVADTRTTS